MRPGGDYRCQYSFAQQPDPKATANYRYGPWVQLVSNGLLTYTRWQTSTNEKWVYTLYRKHHLSRNLFQLITILIVYRGHNETWKSVYGWFDEQINTVYPKCWLAELIDVFLMTSCLLFECFRQKLYKNELGKIWVNCNRYHLISSLPDVSKIGEYLF